MKNIAEQIEAHILSGCKAGAERAIGAEIETIIYNSNGKRIPVNQGTEYSATDFMQAIDSGCKDLDTYLTCSLEPGGQFEWASHPAYHIHDIQQEFIAIQKTMNELCADHELTLIDLALDPIYNPNDIELINQHKYRLMHDCFMATGKHGPWMMRNTASVQVNIDLLSKQDAEECGYIADCISPLAVILFSNAPFMNNHPLGYENIRYRIWEDTDPARCGHLIDQGIHNSAGLLAQYCRYILDVPVIFITPDSSGETSAFNGTIKQWLETVSINGKLAYEDIKTALHQIFTHERYKTVLELRSTDRPPKGFELAPLAFWQGLMEQGKTRNILLETVESWTTAERKDLNLKAATLDISQPGPQNKSILQWFEWLAEQIYTSLDERAERIEMESEREFIEPFIDNVLFNGAFTLQIQEQFAKSGKTVQDFTMERSRNV
ncbi:MAG TPA: glutamate-cysteine ligase family protein [Candidatus Marinimicrobia bacterium]|nr:hypothetical protein [Candidatus Neomarinimicrobiota bacterium]MDP7330238.1 glutamate-cysteine ligase family protein [Candidatus Neomarinimicrobiota bacterium]HJL74401.1 glutamate-cysteine ligase family protein [Candidatus Neomarinimicrobiota bacterium]HJM69261.1 glutamate-cysteine ligase family protein [Candidatus Neomarinimicrobiota bacterium]